MIELTPFAPILRAFGVLYWIIAFGALCAAIAVPKSPGLKVFLAVCVVAAFGWLPARWHWRIHEARERLAAAVDLFRQRCSTAGEKIHRTVDGVDGFSC
jgi:hypothetical protein